MVLHYKEQHSGIYSIINTVNDKIYIGKTTNLYRRKYQHFAQLNSGKHTNEYLAASVKKYGADKFYFNVIEFCDENVLGEREYYWIKHFDSNNRNKGYNIDIINEDGTTTRDWSSSKKMSKTIKKNGGRKIAKGADNPTSKTVYQYSLEGEYLGEFGGAHEAARVLGSPDSFSTISKVARKKTGESLGYQWRYEKFDRVSKYILGEKVKNILTQNNIKLSKPIIAINLLTSQHLEFVSVSEASRTLNISISLISRVAKSKSNNSKKFNMKFFFKEDMNS